MDGKNLNIEINVETNDSSQQIKNVQDQLKDLATSLNNFKLVINQIGPVTGVAVQSIGKLDSESMKAVSTLDKVIKSFKSVRETFKNLHSTTKVTANSVAELDKAYSSAGGSIDKTKEAIKELSLQQKTNAASLREVNLLIGDQKSRLAELTRENEGDEDATIRKRKALADLSAEVREYEKHINVQNNAISLKVATLKEELAVMKENKRVADQVFKADQKDQIAIQKQATAEIKDREKALSSLAAREESMAKQSFGLEKQEANIADLTSRLKEASGAYAAFIQNSQESGSTADTLSAKYSKEIIDLDAIEKGLAEVNAQRKENARLMASLSTGGLTPTGAATTASQSSYDDQYITGMKEKKQALKEVNTEVIAYQRYLKEENAKLSQVTDTLKENKQNIDNNTKSLKENDRLIKNANHDWYQSTIVMRQVGTALSRYITTPVLAAAVASAKYTAEIEMQQKAFGILLDDMEKGMKLYEEVIIYAARTPYQIPELSQATKELLAFGSESDRVMDQLRRLGDIAQNDSEKLDSVVKAFGKVEARGTAHMRELNRFVMAGVPIFKELQNVMNLDPDSFMDAVRAGKVSFDAVSQAVVNLTSAGGKFYNMSETLSQTVSGRFSTVKDEIALTGRAFVEDFMPEIKKAINFVIDLAQALQLMSKKQKESILGFIKFGAVLGPVILGLSNFIKISTQIAKIIPAIKAGITGVNAAAAAGTVAATATPVGWVALILGGVIAIATAFTTYKIKKQIDDTVSSFRDLQGTVADWNSSTVPEVVKGTFKESFKSQTGDELSDAELSRILPDDTIKKALAQGNPDRLKRIIDNYTKNYIDLADAEADLAIASDNALVAMLGFGMGFRNREDILQQIEDNPNVAYLYNQQLKQQLSDYEEVKKNIADLKEKLYGADAEADVNLQLGNRIQKMLTGATDIKIDITDFNDLLASYVAITEESISDAAGRMLKYATDMQDKDNLIAAVDAALSGASSKDIENKYGEGRWISFINDYVTNLETGTDELNKAKQEAGDTIRNVFVSLADVSKVKQDEFLSSIYSQFYKDNLASVFFDGITKGLDKTAEKKKLEDSMSAIEDVFNGFITENWDTYVSAAKRAGLSGAEATIEAMRLAEKDIASELPKLYDEYSKNIEKLNSLDINISFDKEVDKLEASIKTYGKTAKAIDEISYALEGYNQKQIDTLTNLSSLDEMFKTLAENTKEATEGIDPAKLSQVMQTIYNAYNPTIGVDASNDAGALKLEKPVFLEPPKIGGVETEKVKADARKSAENYFKELYSLDAQARAQKEITVEHKQFLADLNKVFGEDSSKIQESGIQSLLDTTNKAYDTLIKNANKTEDEILMATLNSIKATVGSDELKQSIDNVIAKIKEVKIVLDKAELNKEFREELKTLNSEADAIGLVGVQIDIATYKAKGFTEEQAKRLAIIKSEIAAREYLMSITSKSSLTNIDPAELTKSISTLRAANAFAPQAPGVALTSTPSDLMSSVSGIATLGENSALIGEDAIIAKKALAEYYKELAHLDPADLETVLKSEDFAGLKAAVDKNSALLGNSDDLLKAAGADAFMEASKKLDEEYNNIGKSSSQIMIENLRTMGEALGLSTEQIETAVDKVNAIDVKKTFDGIKNAIMTTSLQSLVDALYDVGEAFGSASLSGQTFVNSLKNVILTIMDALPSLLLQAGIQLLTPATWPIGLALIAASGVAALGKGIAHGIVDGSSSETSGGTLASSSVTFSAKGNAFDKGSIISTPTLFKTSSGFNVGGEAGTEGILPLMRNAKGMLGVVASGIPTSGGNSSVVVPVNISIVNQTGVEFETEQTSTVGPSGEQNIAVVIKQVVSSQIAKGAYDRPMQSRYGTKVKGVV